MQITQCLFIIKKKIVLITVPTLMSLFLFGLKATAGESIRWHDEGIKISFSISEILVQHKLCESIKTCRNAEVIFFRSTSDGLELSIYSVSDESTVADILSTCARFLFFNRMEKVDLTVYKISKKAELERSRFAQSYAQKYTIRGYYADN